MGGQEIGNGGIPRLGDGTTAACNQQFAALTRDRGTNAHHYSVHVSHELHHEWKKKQSIGQSYTKNPRLHHFIINALFINTFIIQLIIHKSR